MDCTLLSSKDSENLSQKLSRLFNRSPFVAFGLQFVRPDRLRYLLFPLLSEVTVVLRRAFRAKIRSQRTPNSNLLLSRRLQLLIPRALQSRTPETTRKYRLEKSESIPSVALDHGDMPSLVLPLKPLPSSVTTITFKVFRALGKKR